MSPQALTRAFAAALSAAELDRTMTLLADARAASEAAVDATGN